MSWDIHQGDVLAELRKLPDDYFDALLSDPPYGLSFMGKAWDHGVPGKKVWREVLRVLKPGAPLLAFGGTRTYHRLASAIEDGGFEIRDCLAWMYGSGFPKSLDVSKAIDWAAGAERDVVGKTTHPDGKPRAVVSRETGIHDGGHGRNGIGLPVTAPTTPLAKQWDGYGTALKPAYEPIVLARKPMSGTVASNVERWGVGGLAIDACRIGEEGTRRNNGERPADGWGMGTKGAFSPGSDCGRWPANVLLDEVAAAMLDEQSGELTSGGYQTRETASNRNCYGARLTPSDALRDPDTGGASRFFYIAKADRAERELGHVNPHPTVKPIALAKYLATLILPPPGRVRRLLVPFSGSGSEMIGAMRVGWEEIHGIEREAEYVEIAKARLARWEQVAEHIDDVKKPEPVDDRQTCLFGKVGT